MKCLNQKNVLELSGKKQDWLFAKQKSLTGPSTTKTTVQIHNAKHKNSAHKTHSKNSIIFEIASAK